MPETPILDLVQAPPEPGFRWLSKVIALVVGLAIAGVLILVDQGLLPAWHWPAFNIFLLIPALWVAIAFHELGHLVAGKLVGLDTGGISIGPLALLKSGTKWVVRFDWRILFGGFYKPLTSSPDVHPYRFAWLVAAGPIASLLLAAICWIVAARYSDSTWDWVGTLSWTSLSLVVLALAPFSSGLQRTDGARLWQLIRHPEQARRWVAIIGVQSEEARGLRPHEWNSELLNQILEVGPSTSEFLYSQLLAYARRLDEAREADALQHLERALARSARVGKRVRHALYLEAAFASAMIQKRPAQARTWFARACKLRKPESSDAVEAGIAMCEGRYEQAASHWRAAIEHVTRRRLDSGLIRFAKERWATYEAACRAPIESMSMPADLPKLREFAARYTAAWCSQNPASVAAFFSIDGSLRVNDDAPAVGRHAIAQVAESFMTAFPDLLIAMDDLVIHGDESEYHWTLTGTNRGPGGTGRSVQISGFEKWRFGDHGLIASSQGYFDVAEYRRQLEQAIC